MSATNAFGTYLQTKDLLKSDPVDYSDWSDMSKAVLPVPAFKLLVNQHFPQAVPDLLGASGMSLGEFSDLITKLQETGLVSVTKSEGAETVHLTKQGKELVEG